MREDLLVKGRSLTGTTDLTLLAPLKKGLVPALEAVSYKTRTQRLLRLLNGGRIALHEHALQRPLSDAVERVAKIHSVRVLVFEPEDKVLLSVSFDGTREAYIRVLWQKVGTLLDLIFCNTENYTPSTAGYAAWTAWVERVQRETTFFFSTHGLTVGDVHSLRGEAAIHQSTAGASQAQLAAVRQVPKSAEAIVFEAGQTTTDDAAEAMRQGLQSLALLYRLTDLYLPDTADGELLLRATQDLLAEFRQLVFDPDLLPDFVAAMNLRFNRQLEWLRSRDFAPPPMPAPLPKEGKPQPAGDVQGGALHRYSAATHGCLLLLGIADDAAAARLLQKLLPLITPDRDADDGSDGPFHNIAFTHEGLRRLGLSETRLAHFPHEFREGMEARASVLGDARANHPRRWHLPQRNWPAGAADGRAEGRAVEVPMSAVHAVVQIRAACKAGSDDVGAADYVLRSPIDALMAGLEGVTLLSVQAMQRNASGREHFGFADGQGQPEFDAPAGTVKYANQVPLGEALLGYDNEAEPYAQAQGAEAVEHDLLTRNGSFMVVRKLRQHVQRLADVVKKAADENGLDAALVRAKMMGRWDNGSSLIDYPHTSGPDNAVSNDFDYSADPAGSVCPLHSHVRRCNPRFGAPERGDRPGRRRARILRRGMSYGLPAAAADAKVDGNVDTDRGIVFIAYNASIGEQFEVVQRWVAGGNSSGGLSGQSDPFLGVPEVGATRHFRFEVQADAKAPPKVVTMALDSGPAAFHEPEPFVRLEWGAYLFMPSLRALRSLHALAARQRPALRFAAEAGRARIAALRALEATGEADTVLAAWKAAVEEVPATEGLDGASLWAAIRQDHGGVLRTPYGVLVADEALIVELLSDDRRFSVRGYRERMLASGMDIFLGMDDGADGRLRALRTEVNAAIGRIGYEPAFKLAFALAHNALDFFRDNEKLVASATGADRWELNLDIREVFDIVLEGLCQAWFGVPGNDPAVIRGGAWRWDWRADQAPRCPAHFTPPSRYFFQPRPGDQVTRWGRASGQALAQAMTTFVSRIRPDGSALSLSAGAATRGLQSVLQRLFLGEVKCPLEREAPLAKEILAKLAAEDDATVGRVFAGVIMGFVPTLDGNLRATMAEWLRLAEYGRLRAAWAADAGGDPLLKARALVLPALTAAMQFKPAPELIWRTAARDHDRIGGEPLRQGDVVIAALVSASQRRRETGSGDVKAIFGMRAPDLPAAPGQAEKTMHSCPGYEAAMGVLLGALSAVVGYPEVMKPAPAALSFTLEGAMS